jgi:protein-S-isoprenylcysteine O-methyltransferase Ste14
MDTLITTKETSMVKLGNWIFHYRNYLFPLFYLALFIPSSLLFSEFSYAYVIGLLLIFLGIFIRCITIGFVYIIRGGKNRRIYAENLVTGGVYSICRNPMYLGNILLLFGFGIFSNSLIFLLIFFPLFLLFYFSIIKAEEAFLTNKFGVEFEIYRSRVNALLPGLSRIGRAFENHTFDFKRVIKKEYNSLFIYFSGILLLMFYQEQISWIYFAVVFPVLLLLYLVVKVLKRTHKI